MFFGTRPRRRDVRSHELPNPASFKTKEEKNMGLISVVQIRNNPNDESEWWSGGTKETQENGMQVSVPLGPLNAKASQQCVAALSKTDATTPWQKRV